MQRQVIQLRSVLKLAMPLLVIFELVLSVPNNILQSSESLRSVVTICFIAVFAALIILVRSDYASRTKAGENRSHAIEQALSVVVPHPIITAAKGEIGIVAAIVMAVLRRRDIPQNASPISYGCEMRKVGVVLFVIALVEIPLADLICLKLIPDQNIVRYLIIGFSVYALIWIVGLLCATKAYPHYITGDGTIVFRFCKYRHIRMQAEIIEKVETCESECTSAKLLYIYDETMFLNNDMRSVNLLISLKKPTHLEVDGMRHELAVNAFLCSVDCPLEAKKLLDISLESGNSHMAQFAQTV